ncbi:hypothetical protein PIB30_039292 [Stylosanthes scabra]|uniref:Uncharacterized protein n=1 Tax=Stylosanthes scabra TaxID=79078 RepID=A0ABU6YBL5_9FABA|nr:hypothetical protein [Stylosanthes scabra]
MTISPAGRVPAGNYPSGDGYGGEIIPAGAGDGYPFIKRGGGRDTRPVGTRIIPVNCSPPCSFTADASQPPALSSSPITASRLQRPLPPAAATCLQQQLRQKPRLHLQSSSVPAVSSLHINSLAFHADLQRTTSPHAPLLHP